MCERGRVYPLVFSLDRVQRALGQVPGRPRDSGHSQLADSNVSNQPTNQNPLLSGCGGRPPVRFGNAGWISRA